MAAAEGIVMSKDGNLLACNGGGINLTKDWAKSLLRRMGMVKRRVSSKSKVNVEEFDILKEEFLLSIRNVVSLDEIPQPLPLIGTKLEYSMCQFQAGLWRQKEQKELK